MNQKKKHQVMMSGTGGRGILMIGRLLAEVGMNQYQHVSYFPNYGAAMRGGQSEVTVTLSDDEISSQSIFNPEVALIMDNSFFQPMEARVQAGGTMFIDSSVVSAKGERNNITYHYLPVTEKAIELGNVQVANLVMLGAYLEATKAIPINAVEKALENRMLGTRREALLQLDKEALNAGAKLLAGSEN